MVRRTNVRLRLTQTQPTNLRSRTATKNRFTPGLASLRASNSSSCNASVQRSTCSDLSASKARAPKSVARARHRKVTVAPTQQPL